MPSESILLHLLGLLVTAPLVVMAWRNAERLGSSSILIRSLLLYVCGAHLIKGVMLAMIDWEPSVDSGIVPHALTQAEAVLTAQLILIYSFAVVAACFSITSIFRQLPENRHSAVTDQASSHTLRIILVSLAAILPYKFFINHIMHWGVPALTPTNTIPLVTGVSVYLVRDATLCLCATALYQCFVVIKRPSVPQKILTLVAAMTYVMLDLAMGSKFAMLGMIFAAISLATRAFLKQDGVARLRIAMISALVLLILLPTFQAANILRFVKLDNAFDLIDIVSKTSDKIDLNITNLIFSVLSRATGAEGVAAAVELDGRLSLGFADLLFASDFGPKYTFALSGIAEDNLAFGATLAGTYSLLCRADSLCVGTYSYAVTFVLLGALAYFAARTRLQSAVKYGVATSLALVAVHAQLASGGLLLFGQRIFIILVSGWAIDFLLRKRRPAAAASTAESGAPADAASAILN
jgi:hypothetical protein